MGNTQEQVLAGLVEMNGGTLGERMGIEFLEASPERCVATMPVADSDSLFAYTQGGFQAGKAQVGPLPASRERFLADFGAYNATIERVARETGSILVPMHRLMGSDAGRFVDVVHYSWCTIRAPGRVHLAPRWPMRCIRCCPRSPRSPL